MIGDAYPSVAIQPILIVQSLQTNCSQSTPLGSFIRGGGLFLAH